MSIVTATNVEKKFGDFTALKNFNLQIAKGECVGLLGPNGAGKSTFIGSLYGVNLRSGGDLKVFGLDPVRDARAIKRRLGVVPQENALDEGLTVRENMLIYARFVELAPHEREKRVDELLKFMQLEHKADAMIRFLSGGMKRRLAFVRALLGNPEFLILDEPTTGLDPAVRHLLWEKVKDMRADGKTVLVTTHYMHEAEVLCPRVVIMNKGETVAEGSPKDLIAKHAPGSVAIFEGGDAMHARLQAALPADGTLFELGKQWCLRVPAMEQILKMQTGGLQPIMMRPSNLEDVYLKLTGQELGAND